MSRDVVTVERFIPTPAERIFDLLADPDGHARIDGGGTVTRSRGGSRRLALGDTFGMDMKAGAPYTTRNVVTEFEEGRRIAWQVRAKGFLGKLFTGRTWRYELEPRDGGTLVRETWDNSTEEMPGRLVTRLLAGRNREGMTKTLARIETLTTGD